MTAETQMPVGPRFYFLYALLTLLLFPCHELAHYLVYRSLGIHARMTLNTVVPFPPAQRRPAAELAGPLANLAIAGMAAVAFRPQQRGRRWWAALALASGMLRLVVYLLVVGAALWTGSGLALGNDEPIAAHLMGLPSLSFVLLLAPLFAWIVWTVARTFEGNWPRRAGHLLALGLTTLALGLLVGNALDPWLFPNVS